jgi:apolipoprotein N-acyltransferase
MDSDLVSSLFEWSYTLIVVAITAYFLRRSLKGNPLRKSEWQHWVIFGFVINLYGLAWLYLAYPLLWLDETRLQLLGIALLHSFLSLAVAPSYATISFANHPHVKKSFFPLVFASVLTIAEMGRSLIIATLFYSKLTTIAFHFTIGTIGNALSVTPFIEFAYFGGVFALTFVFGYLLYCIISFTNIRAYKKHLLIVVLLLPCIHYGLPITQPKHNTTIGIITTNFQEPKDSVEEYKKALTAQNTILHQATLSFSSSSPDIIVYPEDTRYLSYLSEENRKDLGLIFPHTLFIDGDTFPMKEGFANVSLFYTPENKKAMMRGKEYLFPFNEYIPPLFKPLFLIFVGKENTSTYTKNHNYSPVYSKKVVSFNDNKIGTLLCSEILSHTTIEKIKNEHPDIVFFQSRLNVFHGNSLLTMYFRSVAKVTAAELRTPLITSTSKGESFIISPYGKVVRSTPVSFSTSTYSF